MSDWDLGKGKIHYSDDAVDYSESSTVAVYKASLDLLAIFSLFKTLLIKGQHPTLNPECTVFYLNKIIWFFCTTVEPLFTETHLMTPVYNGQFHLSQHWKISL